MEYDSGFQSRLMKENKIHEWVPTMPATAYHLDTYKVGQYLKRKAKGHLNYIDDEVVSFEQDDKGYVKSIRTKKGVNISGDLFVDCTGFSRVLIDKIEKNNFVSYRNNLLVNSALTFNIEGKPKNYTHAWAQKYGWLWQIPTQERIGCGYVFEGSNLPENMKSIAFKVVLQPIEKTFTDDEIEKISNTIIDLISKTFEGKLRQ